MSRRSCELCGKVSKDEVEPKDYSPCVDRGRASLAGSAETHASDATSSATVKSVKSLVFLTRAGCVNTPTMRAHFDAALKALGLRLITSSSIQAWQGGATPPVPAFPHT